MLFCLVCSINRQTMRKRYRPCAIQQQFFASLLANTLRNLLTKTPLSAGNGKRTALLNRSLPGWTHFYPCFPCVDMVEMSDPASGKQRK
ncbi:Uncharacterised protein [Salmonella enterica subsp. enterica serovar Bovismorbificans]|uniref:Uncharacterized protein n=1 Tax=Salmonella enterica subsp. enterica serovar Bovismorbificans TaxID=58097 RepID=A0A655E3H8_SALET|nr:Uncharacterised protein [Salmonella enterica subsp. enterica serovar Bovismorbificans]CPR70514.1 Uncharacterised protein [Salmonella enterica subsp. enterica serovar Bovismorbificans]CPR76677.1 Uncharacterised protein [Salmonella enterica subsp. enterica serovar Bovismorbificans]CQB64469.1 Uncharacterised protein [Salmonella enterica subsp. enterica serovar Bovismorbificans]